MKVNGQPGEKTGVSFGQHSRVPNAFEYENFLLIRNKSIGPYVTVTALLVPLIEKIHDDKIYFLTIVFKLTYIHSRNLFSLQRIIGLM